MNFTTMYPPNCSLVSDEVICIVMQNPCGENATSIHSTGISNKTTLRGQAEGTIIDSRWHKKKFVEFTELNRLYVKSKRERRKIIQRRYRDKCIAFKLTLEKTTQNLRVEIETLEEQVRNKALEVAVQPPKDVWSMAVRFFSTFQRCLRLQSRSSESATQFDSLFNFVRASTTPDVLSNAGYGPEMLIRNVSVLQRFDGVDVELKEIKMISANVVVASTKTRLIISEQTLRDEFPHLFDTGANSDSMFSLVENLRDQQIVLLGSIRFVWDPDCDSVASVIFKSDLMTPMLHLIGNLEDLARVFEHPLLVPDFHWMNVLK